MKRVIIIGSGGAGKSTFARHLHELTGLPLFHLDKIYWQPNWTEMPKAEMREIIINLLKGEEWIIDGNFNSTMELRTAASDTVIFLDMPHYLCIFQSLKRVIKYYNKARPDMGENCPEKFDLEFLGWVWNFPKLNKPKIESRLESAGKEKNIVRLKSRKEIESYFENLK